jgi:hypothetical protein
MDLREFSRAYAKSPLGLGSIVAALAAGTGAGLLGLPAALSGLIGLATLAALLAMALVFGVGQRAASGELGREAGAKASSRLAEAALARKRLAGLRLVDDGVAKARDLFVLEAGRFIEDCDRLGSYDPEAVAAIEDSLALVDAWLREADETSVERRFDAPDAHPFPEAAARTAASLRDKAALVAARRAAVTGEISGEDRLAIEEELR